MTGGRTEQLVVSLADGVQLIVRADASHNAVFSIELGSYPRCHRLAFIDGFGVRTRIRGGVVGRPALWCGNTSFDLPWLELLKVADFLQLEIPLPVPLGEQVPA